MLFAGGQDKKTLTDVMRDYRAGLFQKVDVPGIGTAEENCILVNSKYNTDPITPGDIVPLNDFEYFGEAAHVSDDVYSERHLYGCSSRCGTSKNFFGFTEDPYHFTPIPFGIAKDFISYHKYGNVQIHGRSWALIDKVPGNDSQSLIPDENHRYVVIRKNSRFNGKPFLQTAPDGFAEVIYFGKTLENGLTWALLDLGHPYRGTLYKVYNASTDIDAIGTFYSNAPTVFNLASYDGTPGGLTYSYVRSQTLYTSYDYNHPYPFKSSLYYSATHDNYLQPVPIYDFEGDNGFLKYRNFFNDESDLVPHGTSGNSSGFPTFTILSGSYTPFQGGIFTVQLKNENNDPHFRLFDNDIPISCCTSRVHNLELWHGDRFDVYVPPDTAYYYNSTPNSINLSIIAGPTDDPIGTIIPYFQPTGYNLTPPNVDTSRGWQQINWHSNFTDDLAVIYGNGSLAAGGHLHDFTYYDAQGNAVQSQTGTENTNAITYNSPFNLTIFKKVSAGVRFD